MDQDTAIVLTEERLQSMLEAAAKSVAAQVVGALTTRVGGTASLTGSASAGESTLPAIDTFLQAVSVRPGCTLELAQARTLACFRQ